MEQISLIDAMSFRGYLEKKSPSLFGGWQKRYFKILEGRVLTYSEKEKDKESKGSINLEDVSDIKVTDKKCFSFYFGDRTWDLRAESDQDRDKWVSVLNLLISEIKRSSAASKSTEEEIPEGRGRGESKVKKWKNNQQDSATIEILKKSGFTTSKDDELSEKAIKIKLRTLNYEIPDVKSRIMFGFLNKKHKKDYLFQKRWFFIISSRPVNDADYEKDDNMIFKNPSGIALDTLYYYSFDSDTDDSKAKGEIPMSECSELSSADKDNKFFLIVDVGDRKYEFQSDIKGERDKWYECLKNSRKTAKDIKKSITKKPRNITRLLRVIENEGIGKLREVCEKEKENVLMDYKDVKDFDLFEGFYVKNLQELLYQTLDGCILSDTPKTEIIKTYVETFNTSYLLLVQRFWTNCYSNLDQSQIIKMASYLFSHEETLSQFGVTDPNFSQNGRELIKIIIKKTFNNLKTLIESILKNEREVKAVKAGEGMLITNGPVDLFKMLYSVIDIFKKENHKIKYIPEQFLNLCKECIVQYLIGVDSVIAKRDLDIDKEFLIAISNNSIKINSQFEDLLDEMKAMNLLSDKEVEDCSGQKEITSSLTLISNNAISRFVSDLSDALVAEFQDHFLSLELNKILEVTFDTYGLFTTYMHVSVQKKCWNEVLKATLYQYIKSLLTTAHKKVKQIEDLTGKIRADKEVFIAAYQRVLGEHLTRETLKILDDFLDFLDVSPEMISVSCTKLREFNGPSFTVATAKALINLRCDLNKNDKTEAINSCKEILESYNSKGNYGSNTNNKSSGFFENLESDIQDQEKEENAENLEEIEEAPKDKRRKTMNLTDFLGIGVDVGDLDDEGEKEPEDAPKIVTKGPVVTGEMIVSDVVFEGVMKKKSYSTWQERFFQIKNNYLYWYKSKTAKESQNSLSISEMKKVQGHKLCKFLIVCGEKVYKFSCETDEDKELWIKALNSEIKRIKGDSVKKIENIFDVKLKKKVITDFYNLPNINADKLYMKHKVDEAMRTENFFPEKQKVKPNIRPNKKITDKKTMVEEKIIRKIDEKPLNTSTNSANISALEIGLIDRKHKPNKNRSIFSCCNKLLMMFKKKKTTDEDDSRSIS